MRLRRSYLRTPVQPIARGALTRLRCEPRQTEHANGCPIASDDAPEFSRQALDLRQFTLTTEEAPDLMRALLHGFIADDALASEVAHVADSR